MKKILGIVLQVMLLLGFANAQTSLKAWGKQNSDSTAIITINIEIEKGLKLFSTHAKSGNDGFVSTLDWVAGVNNKKNGVNIQESGTSGELTNAIIGEAHKVFSDSMQLVVEVKLSDTAKGQVKGIFNYLGIDSTGENYPSGSLEFTVPIDNLIDNQPINQQQSSQAPKKGWGLFLLTFLVGFGAVFTPCVFPLMPVTVSYFLKKSKTRAQGVRNAWTYALSIVLIYTIPTLIFTLIFGDKFLYQLSTHPISNLVFFMIFLMFAISFFGAFEINLPSSWANKTDSAARQGGLLGIFFMALTLVIVSFSCTGPIVGALLGETSGKGISMGPVIGMLGFGLGLSIPFGILALFPSMLQSLPKSGGWLNTVKVFFGFIELALAMKFFSNADLVYHWGILTRPVFLAGWIVIFTLLGMYMLGKLKFSHDSDLPYISVPRIFVAMVSFTFALYMLPGMWGAPLKPLSGILPPPSTQDFDLDKLQYLGGSGNPSTLETIQGVPKPVKYTDKFHVPFGLTAYFDLEEAKAASKILKKPIMLDFTGWSCANCRKMENEVWSKPEILNKLKNDFILVSLFVDDRTELPIAEQYVNAVGEKIITIGDKNLDLEITAFDLNAQPLYKFMDHEGNLLSPVQYGYDPDVAKFAAHLNGVINTYKQKWEK